MVLPDLRLRSPLGLISAIQVRASLPDPLLHILREPHLAHLETPSRSGEVSARDQLIGPRSGETEALADLRSAHDLHKVTLGHVTWTDGLVHVAWTIRPVHI